jgi:hypothetical protein
LLPDRAIGACAAESKQEFTCASIDALAMEMPHKGQTEVISDVSPDLRTPEVCGEVCGALRETKGIEINGALCVYYLLYKALTSFVTASVARSRNNRNASPPRIQGDFLVFLVTFDCGFEHNDLWMCG